MEAYWMSLWTVNNLKLYFTLLSRANSNVQISTGTKQFMSYEAKLTFTEAIGIKKKPQFKKVMPFQNLSTGPVY